MKQKMTKEEFLDSIQEGVVYCFTNKINGKRYIGLTIHPKSHGHKSRYNQHVINSRRYQKVGKNHISAIDAAILRYGIDNFEYEELFYIKDKTSVVKSELDHYEIHYISLYDTANSDKGYNIMKGGAALQYSRKENSNNWVRISQYDLNGNLIKIFNNTTECLNELNLSSTTFYKLMNKIPDNVRTKNFYDYTLEYTDGTGQSDSYKRSYKKVIQYDQDYNIIRIFDSFKLASSEGYEYKQIRKCLKGLQYSYKGYLWKYVNDEENIHLTDEEIEKLKILQIKHDNHEGLKAGAHKVVCLTYDLPEIMCYYDGILFLTFLFRWQAVKFFIDNNTFTMALFDKRLKYGNISKTSYPRLPYPNIEICYAGNENNLNVNKKQYGPHYNEKICIHGINILKDRLLQGRDEYDSSLTKLEKDILNELNLRICILNQEDYSMYFEIFDKEIIDDIIKQCNRKTVIRNRKKKK